MAPPEIAQVICSAQAAAEADEHYDPFKDPKRRPTKSKDPGWKYAFWPNLDDKWTLQCNLCGKKVPSGVCRMKKHLAGGFPVVEKCPRATAEIRKEMHEYLRSHGHKFQAINLDSGGGEDEEGEEGQTAASSKASNTSGKRKTAVTTSYVGASEPKRQTKMVSDDDLQSKISKLADDYERTEGDCFTKQMAMKDRVKKSPLLWWGAYGGLAYELQCLAKRIISLCASSSGCERNWSVFAHIHTKGRNRLEYKRLNKLSYVSYNRQMANRFQKLREEGSKAKTAKALILEAFQWDNEWVDISAELVHQNEAEDVDGSNSLRWTQVDEAMGATESLQGRNFPRRARGDASESSRPIGPYITYRRRVPTDPTLRAELEELHESDLESSDDDNDDSAGGIEKDQDFEVDMDMD